MSQTPEEQEVLSDVKTFCENVERNINNPYGYHVSSMMAKSLVHTFRQYKKLQSHLSAAGITDASKLGEFVNAAVAILHLLEEEEPSREWLKLSYTHAALTKKEGTHGTTTA